MDEVELLLDDPPCLVFNKPGGLLTQAPLGIDNLEVRVRAFEKLRHGLTGKIYLGLPHRLDRPASGAIVFARNVRATRRLCDQFASRQVEKRYWVLVEGQPAEERGTWQDFLRKIPGEARVEVVPPDHAEGRRAVLHYRVLGQDPFFSWLEVLLETGRTHQIRVQCASRGLPILGDEQYGSTVPFGPSVDHWRCRWIALHARQLVFKHPKSQRRVAVEAPLPDAWRSQLPDERWRSVDPK